MSTLLKNLLAKLKTLWQALVAKAENKVNPTVVTVVAAPVVTSVTSQPVTPLASTPIQVPAPVKMTPLRDPNVVGPKVVAWALPSDSGVGAEPQIGINGCDYVTTYVVANPAIDDSPTGYQVAYLAVKDIPVVSVQGNPMGTVGAPAGVSPKVPATLTPAIANKLGLYQAVCKTDADKVGYLILAGNNDLFNYLVSTTDMSWFNAAYDATRAGEYDATSNTNFDNPVQRRVWQPA